MPFKSSALLVICIIVALCSTTLAKPILDDLFNGFIRDSQLANEPPKDRAVVKRRIYAENPDASLKQISLQSLIGDVEDSLYQTALSVSSVAHNNDHVVPEVKPNTNTKIDNNNDRSVIKRETEINSKNGQYATTTESSAADQESKNIYLQTTQKVPAGNGMPAHVLIDRVAVQSHQGGLPIIPAFQLYHTKVISATFKEPTTANNDDGSNANGGSTKISIAQTNSAGVPVITIATTNQNGNQLTVTTKTDTTAATKVETTTTTTGKVKESIHPVQDIHQASTSTSSIPLIIISSSTDNIGVTEKTMATSTTTTTNPITTTTTKLPIVQLKEAEEELKEKVAEIEAEPVILTARV